MKDFLIGVGIGFAVGAILCKTCKPVANMAQKAKDMVQEKIEEGKEVALEKAKEAKQTVKKQANNK